VFYKRGIYTRAITYLQEAREKSPNNAIIHYHLGMAYYKNGEGAKAKEELKRSLELDPKFPGADEAKATFQKLG
jgi:Flp pilus assembly protein TadD